ncbi:MAG: hypothetical protein ACYTHN_24845, partial [Planctomycetota bacterium]
MRAVLAIGGILCLALLLLPGCEDEEGAEVPPPSTVPTQPKPVPVPVPTPPPSPAPTPTPAPT